MRPLLCLVALSVGCALPVAEWDHAAATCWEGLVRARSAADSAHVLTQPPNAPDGPHVRCGELLREQGR